MYAHNEATPRQRRAMYNVLKHKNSPTTNDMARDKRVNFMQFLGEGQAGRAQWRLGGGW
jgi:hypothetical protein